MRFKFLFFIAVFGMAVCSFSFTSCDEKGVDEGADTVEVGPVYAEKSSPIESMVVYIDASASVKGYFSNGSDGKFGNAIFCLANYNRHKFPVYFWGDTTEVNTELDASGGINTSLQSRSSFGQDTYFNLMFDQMVKMVENGSLEAVCLVTDGIFGVGNSLTRQDTSAVPKRLDQLKLSVSKAFIEKDVAVGIYKLSGKFYSDSQRNAYITYQNRQMFPIEIEDRPFYVIIIGKPEQIRDFSENNELNADLSLNLGTHDMEMHSKCKLCDFKHFKNGQWVENNNDNTTNLTMHFPACIGNEEYLKENTKVSLNGEPLTKEEYAIVGDKLTITKKIEGDAKIKSGKNSFKVIVKNAIPEEWKSLYCDDDMKIKTDKIAQGQTFGLQYLLEGIFEGTKPGKGNLMEIKYEFNK